MSRSTGGLTDRRSSDVAFSVLGPVAAFDSDGAVLSLGSHRRQALLAALLLNLGHPLSVDQLIDMLWSGMAPPTAATMVHGAVAGLRKALVSRPRGGGGGHGGPPRAAEGTYWTRDQRCSTCSGSNNFCPRDASWPTRHRRGPRTFWGRR